MDILTKDEETICIGHFELIKNILSRIKSDSDDATKEIDSLKEKMKFWENVSKNLASRFFKKRKTKLDRNLSEIDSLYLKLESDYSSYFLVFNRIRFGMSIPHEEIIEVLTSLSQKFKDNPSVPIEISVDLWKMKIDIQTRLKIPDKKTKQESLSLCAEPFEVSGGT